MFDLSVQSMQLTQATMLRRTTDGVYSAIENVDVVEVLASVQAISLCSNRLHTLEGLEFCTNLRALDVRFRFRDARTRARCCCRSSSICCSSNNWR